MLLLFSSNYWQSMQNIILCEKVVSTVCAMHTTVSVKQPHLHHSNKYLLHLISSEFSVVANEECQSD